MIVISYSKSDGVLTLKLKLDKSLPTSKTFENTSKRSVDNIIIFKPFVIFPFSTSKPSAWTDMFPVFKSTPEWNPKASSMIIPLSSSFISSSYDLLPHSIYKLLTPFALPVASLFNLIAYSILFISF